ncbi:DUF5683 domain-containing protein [Terrimonas sp.]|uniref:DUF5683 domain-containing protein n=1 Tax=Terrimonas sp. TaxID=1914338 RepID=UPI001056F458|nr:DUF5683 domain-containing protein [Terrimonas sp.]
MLTIGRVNAQQDTLPGSRDTLPKIAADTLHKDSVIVTHAPSIKSDSLAKLKIDTAKKINPAKRAALLSAILPGAGQAYNKKYWKMPIVYGALAIPVYTFTDNLKWFNRTRFAYNTLYSMMNLGDSSGYESVYPQLKPFVDARDQAGLKNYRSEFRKNVDYSVLAFIALWGLQVMDAAVDGHLRDFNVSDDLSIQLKPGLSPMANTAGLSIVFNIGKNHIASTSPPRRKTPIFAN